VPVFYFLVGLIVTTALIMALPVKLTVAYGREGEKDRLTATIFIWPVFKYKFRVAMIDFRAPRGATSKIKIRSYKITNIARALKRFFSWSDVIKSIRSSVNGLLNKTIILKLKWRTVFGTGDPYSTGIVVAFVWSLKGYLLSAACNRLRARCTPLFSVTPYFGNAAFFTSFDCILKTRTGYIIFTGVRILAMLIIKGKLGSIIKMAKKTGRG